jgi:hypothetical protein
MPVNLAVPRNKTHAELSLRNHLTDTQLGSSFLVGTNWGRSRREVSLCGGLRATGKSGKRTNLAGWGVHRVYTSEKS